MKSDAYEMIIELAKEYIEENKDIIMEALREELHDKFDEFFDPAEIASLMCPNEKQLKGLYYEAVESLTLPF